MRKKGNIKGKPHALYFFVFHVTYHGFQHRVSPYKRIAANTNVVSISLDPHWTIILAMIALAAVTEILANCRAWHCNSLFLTLFTLLCGCLWWSEYRDPSSFYLVEHLVFNTWLSKLLRECSLFQAAGRGKKSEGLYVQGVCRIDLKGASQTPTHILFVGTSSRGVLSWIISPPPLQIHMLTS